MKNKKKMKKIISYIVACILGIGILAEVVVIGIYNTVFNRDKLEHSLVESNYYYNMYEIIINNLEGYRLQSGFGEHIFDNVVTEDMVRSDIKDVINSLFANQKIEISTEELENKLEQNIQKEVQEKNYRIDDEARASIDNFKKVISESYKMNIMYSETSMSDINKSFKDNEKKLRTAMIVLLIIDVVVAAIIFKIRRSSIGIGLLIAGTFLLVARFYSGVSVTINNIMVFNWAFSATATFVLNKLVQGLFISGIVLVVLGIAWICVFEYLRSKKIFNYGHNNK